MHSVLTVSAKQRNPPIYLLFSLPLASTHWEFQLNYFSDINMQMLLGRMKSYVAMDMYIFIFISHCPPTVDQPLLFVGSEKIKL